MEVPIRSDIQDSLGFPKCNGPKKTSYHHFVTIHTTTSSPLEILTYTVHLQTCPIHCTCVI